MAEKTAHHIKFFYQISSAEAVERLKADAKNGLTEDEAKKRLAQHGHNILAEGKRRPMVFRFFDQFKDLMIIVLIVAALFSFYLGDFHSGTILLVIVMANAAIGFYQEYKAEKILESLKKIIRAKATVIRDGQKKEIEQEELVPGDLIYLEEGGGVPADVRLTQTTNFSTNDFILTGESTPQEKFADLVIDKEMTLTSQDNLVFLGVTAAKGNAYGIVYGTGMDTAIGRIAKTSEAIGLDLSPLQKEMNAIAKTLTKIAGFIALGLFVINFLLRMGAQDIKLTFHFSLLLAIGVAAACVPQGLPAQISVALSLGVNRMAKRKAIVRKLSAVETLGSTTVICSDKTGTITKNEMTITRCYVNGREFEVTGDGYNPKGSILEGGKKVTKGKLAGIKQFFEDGFLASNGRANPPDSEHRGWYAIGDPTEAAFTPLAVKAGFRPKDLEGHFPLAHELPFDSSRKRMTVIRRHKGKLIAYMKGGLESVLSVCTHINHLGVVTPLIDEEREQLLRKGEEYANQALRVIALAYRDFPVSAGHFSVRDSEKDFIFSGFTAMIDPPRAGVKEAVKAAYAAHIRVMMITGDNAVTAKAIAERIGMGKNGDLDVHTGDDIKKMGDHELKEVLKARSVIFSRVSPQDKYRLVTLLKHMGDVVAVTGDGVNDTLSLKKSDIGVAMGKMGSEVAKEASEIVLLDDNFHTLIAAIREGRTIYNNLRKTIVSNITANLGELSTVLLGFIGIAFGLPAPIAAVQILAVDLIAELLPNTALTFDSANKNLLTRPPRDLNDHVINRYSLASIAFFGLCHGIISFYSFIVIFHQTGDLAHAQAATYAALVVCQLINILSERTEESIFSHYLFTNPKLWISILISAIAVWSVINVSSLNVWFGFSAMSLKDWIYPFAGGLVLLIIHEAMKLAVRLRIIKHGLYKT